MHAKQLLIHFYDVLLHLRMTIASDIYQLFNIYKIRKCESVWKTGSHSILT
jgi:hypothetical protein